MSSSVKRLFGQTAIYGLPSIIGRLLNYFLVPLYTAVFTSPSDYGVLSDLYAYVAFLVVLLPLGMETAYFRFIQSHEDKNKVFNACFLTVSLTNLLFFVLIYFTNPWIAKWMLYPNHPEYIFLIGLIVCIDALSALPLARLRAENQAKRFVLIQLFSIVVNVVLNVFLLLTYFDPLRPEEGILLILIVNLISSVIKFALVSDLIYSVKFIFDWGLSKKLIAYSFPLVIAGFAGIINETLDRVLLKQLLYNPDVPGSLHYATAQVGIYSACYKLAMLVTIFLQAYRYAAEPFFFSQMHQEDKHMVFKKTMNIFIAVVCFAFLFVSINLGFFKYFIRNEAYYEGLAVVPILLIANVFLGIYYNQSVWYKLSNKTLFGAYISIGGALVTILLNLWLIPLYGYMASAWATLLAYFIQMVLSYYLGRRYYPIPYNTHKFFLYLGSSCLIFLVFSAVRIGLGLTIEAFNQPLLLFGNGLVLLFVLMVYRNEKDLMRPKKIN